MLTVHQFFLQFLFDLMFVVLVFQELVVAFQILQYCLHFERLEHGVLLGEFDADFPGLVVERSFVFTLYDGLAHLAVSLDVVVAVVRGRQLVLALSLEAEADLVSFGKAN